MKPLKILILTDHTNHSSENALYALARAMYKHPLCLQLDVATRGLGLNDGFFKYQIENKVFVSSVDNSFEFTYSGKSFNKLLRRVHLQEYDMVWLRLPPPLSEEFLNYLKFNFPKTIFINEPRGIFDTGSKAFLMNFADVCPAMKICKSVEDILEFKNQFPIVLKPFREYGGKGIVRIEDNRVWEGVEESSLEDFIAKIEHQKIEYLGVEFLKNVHQGDKRIIVVNGEIMGASLRLPAKGSWICNVAMGGNSNFAEADQDEIEIVKRIHPTLSEMGIVMYGIDTLVGNDGRRILSEINTTSIGGLPQIAQMTGKPLVQKAVQLILDCGIQKSQKNVLTDQ